MRKSLGYTLVEVLLASSLALVVIAVILRAFFFARDLNRDLSSSYLVRQDAEIAYRRIQDDLRLTHLSSLRVQPGDVGFSCPSPLIDADNASFELTPYGVCRWKSLVHYTVVPKGNYLGNLVRWEAKYPADQLEPQPSSFKPQEIQKEVSSSLLSGVVQAGTGLVDKLPNVSYEKLGPLSSKDGGGGLRVRFLRRESNKEVLTLDNPGSQDDTTRPGWSKGVTGIVDCRLQVAEVSGESGRWSVYTIAFRVAPRN